MKIVFLSGTARHDTLRYLLENNVKINYVVTPVLTRANRRFEKLILVAAEFGIPIYSVKKETVTELLLSLEYELLISCGFSFILSEEVLNKARYAINSHPTLLPRYRGYRSGPYLILNGEQESGVTIHFLTAEMDKGNIIMQERFPISMFDTTKSVMHKAMRIEGKLLSRSIFSLLEGNVIGIPQDESKQSTYNYMRKPEDSRLDWNKSLRDLYNEIRACDPDDYPAFFEVDGTKVYLRLWTERVDKCEFEI